jgi:hypothetical protein
MKHPIVMALAALLLLTGGLASAAESARPTHASFPSLDDGSARSRIVPQSVQQYLDNGDGAMHRDEQNPSDRRR